MAEYYEALKKSDETVVSFFSKGKVKVEKAQIIWKNFSGVENQFGNKTKNFTLIIPLYNKNAEGENVFMPDEFKARGFYVKEKVLEDIPVPEGSDPVVMYYINVKVNFNSPWPPRCTLFTEIKGKKVKRELFENTISELDVINFQRADLIINSNHSTRKGEENKVTGYLNLLNVIQGASETDFGGAYDDWNVNQTSPLEDDDNVY